MKQNCILLMILLFCTACTTNENIPSKTNEVVIAGNLIKAAAIYECNESNHTQQKQTTCQSRTATASLGNGTQIAFYALGGIEADGQLLTLQDGYWKGEHTISWKEHEQAADICAYYPAISQQTESLHDTNGQLKDILIAQASYTTNLPILLHFEHLFTQFNFNVEPQLNEQLQEILFVPHQLLTSINPHRGQLTTTANENKKGITFQQRTNHIYSILLPSSIEQAIDITIHTHDGRTLKKTLNKVYCKRNQAYICQIKEKLADVGINTAEDYIAFTHLINGTNYQHRSLKEFRTTKDGIHTYYLNKDIHFTDQEKSRIRQIGLKGFKDVFDGQGHTLSNVNMKEESSTYPALFTEITNTGTVKNLHVKNSTTNFKSSKGCTAIICGKNKGKILNCSIENCKIIFNKYTLGGIAGLNAGLIANCKVDNLTISAASNKETDSDKVGGITAVNSTSGKILNCMTSHLKLSTYKQKKKTLSCIVLVNEGTVSNCLSNQCPKAFHPFCEICRKPCDHCYYPAELHYAPEGNDEMTIEEQNKHSIGYYKNDPNSKRNIVNRLNIWIDNQGAKLYSNIPFERWKLNADNSFSF